MHWVLVLGDSNELDTAHIMMEGSTVLYKLNARKIGTTSTAELLLSQSAQI
jgi:hypothetical protein